LEAADRKVRGFLFAHCADTANDAPVITKRSATGFVGKPPGLIAGVQVGALGIIFPERMA